MAESIVTGVEDVASLDRVYHFPRHRGPNIFPNNPLFSKLLRHAHYERVAIRDLNLEIEKSFGQLLSDALGLRGVLESFLDAKILCQIELGHEVYIGVLAAGGYEFAVAMLAVLALGAAAVPMTPALPVEEAAYFVTKSRQVAILSSTSAEILGASVAKYVNTRHRTQIKSLEIMSNLPRTTMAVENMLISADRYLDDNAAGVVIFTSGTTGPPKGAVMRRAFIHDSAISVADHYNITHQDTILHVLPVHHATGLGITFFPFLLSGSCIEFRSGSFDPAWMWERWRKGRLTFFSGVPTIYMRMMRFFDQHLRKLPEFSQAEYIAGANQFRVMLCGSSALPRPVQDFWTTIRDGKGILTRYGATEFGAVCKVQIDPGDTPNGSVGPVFPGVDIKLSEGDEGEILVKSPYMFSKYLFDDKATATAHDENGYFRTGDIGRRVGKYYFIIGRASLDIIKSGGYKISALDIERECLGLPYISEAMVVGVDDDEFGQRVGAVVTLREDQTTYSSSGRNLTLDDLRSDLRGKLSGYKLPTLLRIYSGELPKGQSGKVLKKLLGPQLFPPQQWNHHPEIQVWNNKKLVMASL